MRIVVVSTGSCAYGDITPWAGAELKKRGKLLDYVKRVYEACELPVPACVG